MQSNKANSWNESDKMQRCISFHFIFIYLGTVAPSVHENCFSGGRGTNVTTLRFDSSLKGGKRSCLFNIKFKAIPKLRSTKRYSPLPIVSFSQRYRKISFGFSEFPDKKRGHRNLEESRSVYGKSKKIKKGNDCQKTKKRRQTICRKILLSDSCRIFCD